MGDIQKVEFEKLRLNTSRSRLLDEWLARQLAVAAPPPLPSEANEWRKLWRVINRWISLFNVPFDDI